MAYLEDKVVLLTGGTGSFGQKFTSIALAEHPPRKLIIYSRDELKQSQMRERFDQPCMRYFIGDVRDRSRLERAMQGVDVVIHAAALKQVPACEYNPIEAVKTNVHGAENIVDAAIDTGVEKVLALSSDKAVNPVNLYGATKLCAERLFVQGNAYSGAKRTRFACVRYGNVVGSRGSVIPLFLKQRETGELTVTDERMTRFWITLDQGVRFVLASLERMRGGEVFVPKIPSMRIMDLAKAVAPETRIAFVGIRPGEKLHELLISPDEARHTVELEDSFIVQPTYPWYIPDHQSEGKRLPSEFMYRSDQNPEKLSVAQLRRMVEGAPIEDGAGLPIAISQG